MPTQLGQDKQNSFPPYHLFKARKTLASQARQIFVKH